MDVEQIMREIRSRIAARGVELSDQQIQELAARRLEAVLDPSGLKPSLMDELRRAAGVTVEAAPTESHAIVPSSVETTLWASSNPVLRFVRWIMRPFLTLLINPAALAEALTRQAEASEASAVGEQEQRQRQAEWNGLHYEIVRRLVNDIVRAQIDARDLAMRVESLAGKVDFNERRVRGLEQALHQARSVPRVTNLPAPAPSRAAGEAQPDEQSSSEAGTEGARRRRRRRRGRRPGLGSPPAETGAATVTADRDSVAPDAEARRSNAGTVSLNGEDSAYEERDLGEAETESPGPAPGASVESGHDASPGREPAPDAEPVEQDLFERPPAPPSDPE